MGGGRPRAGAGVPPSPTSSVIPAPPPRHSCAGRNPRRQEPAHPPTPPSPIHPSPLLGGRLGGGWEAPSGRRSNYAPPSPTPPAATAVRHSCSFPSFLRRQEPAQAAGTAPTHPHSPPSPIHPSPLLGGRLGGGWEAPSVRKSNYAPQSPRHPSPPPPSVIPAQAGTYRHSCAPSPSFLRRQEPRAPTPTPPLPQFIPPPF